MHNFSSGQFEFLIIGDVELTPGQFNTLIVPTSFQIDRVERNGWIYFQAGSDEFSYSWEIPGIQLTFNKECTFQKAKKIADEVVQNLNAAGFDAELVVIDNSEIIKFE